MIASVVARQTFRMHPDRLEPVAAESGWPLFDKMFTFDGVTLQPDGDFRKRVLDVLLFGAATAPEGEPVRQLDVSVASGRFRAACTVSGDRVWRRGHDGTIRMSEAEPFTTMKLTNDRSYGGHAPFGGSTTPHMTNPAGRGYYWSEEDACDNALPNIEPAGNVVSSWEERPRPFCFHKPSGVEAAEEEVVVTARDLMSASRMQALFSNAARDFRTAPAAIGQYVTLAGMAVGGPMTLPLPPVRGPVCDVVVGARHGQVPSVLSMLLLLIEPMVLVATYTAHFRYLFVPHDLRRTVLR